ncbi:hypothetical protein [Vandammella animalimorsus]|uniref:hypothetical protein n=1 Tax=Vandammella animalimorsus TaxID=2029117 RepID=UPI00117802B8|nr:hypothetical protein [Vandammella animalimorsus]
MFKKTALYQAVLSLLAVTGASQLMGAPLELADTPPGTGFKPPKPNVIITLDNSGSMAFDIDGCYTDYFLRRYYGAEVYRVIDGELFVRNRRPIRNRSGDIVSYVNFLQDQCSYEMARGGYGTISGVGLNRIKKYDRSGFPTSNTVDFYVKARPGEQRMFMLKRSLRQAITSPDAVPEGSIRLAWQAMWKNNGETMDASTITRGAVNSMRSFEGEHRERFLDYLNSLDPYQGTPSHKMMKQVFDYMSEPGLDIDSPWAKEPGVKGKPYLECRRAYHIFLTDGAWNSQSSSLMPPSGSRDENSIASVGGV